MGPRVVWRDLCRSVRGAAAFWRYLRTQDTVALALGLFEAASSVVTVGRPCRYIIRIANASKKVGDVKVTLRMSLMTAANVPAQFSRSFAKHCTVRPRSAIEIECHYDWGATVVFMVGQMAFPPDECWMGEVKTAERYVVSAVLSDHTGKHLDRLDIYQELLG